MTDALHKHMFMVLPGDLDIRSSQEHLERLVARGEDVTAACGFVWTPTLTDRSQYPSCPECHHLVDDGTIVVHELEVDPQFKNNIKFHNQQGETP